MKWLYLAAAATVIIGMIIGLIIGRSREKRLSQKQLEVRRNSFRYAFSALIAFEALLMVLHYFDIVIPFYWLTFGPIFVAGFAAMIYELIHRAYWPENTRIRGKGWGWTFIIIGILVGIPTVLKLAESVFNFTLFLDMILAIFLILDGIGALQMKK